MRQREVSLPQQRAQARAARLRELQRRGRPEHGLLRAADAPGTGAGGAGCLAGILRVEQRDRRDQPTDHGHRASREDEATTKLKSTPIPMSFTALLVATLLVLVLYPVQAA